MKNTLPLIAALSLVFASSSTEREIGQHIAPNLEWWTTNLEQPIRQLKSDLESATQQQQMNYNAANLGFVTEALLKKRFRSYIALLDAPSASEAIKVQKAWMKIRRRKASAEAKQYEGGSMESLTFSMNFLSSTRQRIKVVEKQIAAVKIQPKQVRPCLCVPCHHDSMGSSTDPPSAAHGRRP